MVRNALITVVVLNLLVMGTRLFGHVKWLDDWGFTPVGRICSIALLAASFLAILFFVVDAFRRQYDQERPLAIALAFTGVLSLGLTTVLYYLRWGSQPVRFQFNDHFCETCLQSSEECNYSLNLQTFNYVIGGRLVGQSCRCAECGSTVRTHCFFLFGIPVYSAGSFRVQCPATDLYIVRKCEFHWAHILTISLMPAAVLTFVAAVLAMD